MSDAVCMEVEDWKPRYFSRKMSLLRISSCLCSNRKPIAIHHLAAKEQLKTSVAREGRGGSGALLPQDEATRELRVECFQRSTADRHRSTSECPSCRYQEGHLGRRKRRPGIATSRQGMRSTTTSAVSYEHRCVPKPRTKDAYMDIVGGVLAAKMGPTEDFDYACVASRDGGHLSCSGK